MNNEEYPRTFTEQIESADNNETSPAVLGMVMGKKRYLIPMTEVNEVIPIPKLGRVPLTKPWFLGLINVRGNLCLFRRLSHANQFKVTHIRGFTRRQNVCRFHSQQYAG